MALIDFRLSEEPGYQLLGFGILSLFKAEQT